MKELEKIINELQDKIMDTFREEIPEELMKTYGITIMYNTITHLLYRYATAINMDYETLSNNLRIIFNQNNGIKTN